NAEFALKGTVDDELLAQLLEEKYFNLRPPKSTGRELFNLTWLDNKLSQFNLSTENVQRTLCEYTALTIANEVTQYTEGSKPELLVCGGGVHNPLLIQRLSELLPEW
ncbi:anhydro-N-acetylmuramic acid kinase, partial [Vibrio xuii]